MTTGLLIFALTYLLIAVQRLPFVHLNRPAASLLGAVAMVVCGVLSLPDAYAAIDLDVLVFLLASCSSSAISRSEGSSNGPPSGCCAARAPPGACCWASSWAAGSCP